MDKSNLISMARQLGKTNTAINDMVMNAPTPSAMLQAARAAGKTEAEINAFAASQPMTPVAVKGTRVFVRDCFGRVFGMDNVDEKEIAALVRRGVPYTPYSNREMRRADVRAERRSKQKKVKKKGRDLNAANGVQTGLQHFTFAETAMDTDEIDAADVADGNVVVDDKTA